MSNLSHLECTSCDKKFKSTDLHTLCTCGKVLFSRYDLEKTKETLTKNMENRKYNLWRMEEIMPCASDYQFSLGEGWSPILNLSEKSGLNISIKDEGINPTGTFKARGLCAAVSKAVELGVNEFVIPTAGNAGAALAAYCARTNTKAHVYMPKDAPNMIKTEVIGYGAELILVDGIISDAGKLAKEKAMENNWFDVSTLKEPYRVEGKKTMGLEIAEQYDWTLPEVLIYPTGGGTGIIGIAKAFDELETLGLISSDRPRFVAVQSQGCAPIVKAFEENQTASKFWDNADTIAPGLRVPKAIGDYLILDVIKNTKGTAIAVSDDMIIQDMKMIAKNEGLFLSPEAIATYTAYTELRKIGWIDNNEQVLLISTANGLTVPDFWNSIQ